MKKLTVFLYLFLVLLVSSCALTSSYKIPDNVDSSNLRIKVDDPESMGQVFIGMLDADNCSHTGLWANIIGGPASSFEKNRISMIGSQKPTKGILEYKIMANKKYSIVASVAAMSTTKEDIIAPFVLNIFEAASYSKSRLPLSCKAPAFMAEPNKNYEVVYFFKPQEECSVNIYELSKDDKNLILRKDITHDLKLYADRVGQFSKYKCTKL